MAKKKRSGGSVFGKLSSAVSKGVQDHKDDETVLQGGGDLPAGIEGGIARLVLCKFDRYKSGDLEGEPYFMAQGVVVRPIELDGVVVEGLRTGIGPEPICETPSRSRKTVDDHVGYVLNHLRLLGVDTSELTTDTDMQEAAEALEEEQPHFRFRTWKGDPTPEYPNPRVRHDWRGVVTFDEEADDGIEDETEEEAPKKAAAKKGTKKKGAAKKKKGTKKKESLAELAEAADNGDTAAGAKLASLAEEAGIEDYEDYETWEEVADLLAEGPPEPEEEADEEEASDEMTLDELGAAANEGDETAIEALVTMAEAEGEDPDDYEQWSDLAMALSGAEDEENEEEEDGDEAEEDEEEEGFEPEKGDVYFYKPPKKRKKVECEVTAVFPGKETCNLKSLDDSMSYQKVPWSKLSEEA